MLQRGVIDMERHAALAAIGESNGAALDGALLTTELMALAISWGVCGSAAEFWQTHKGRDDLLHALYAHEAEARRLEQLKAYEAEQVRERALAAILDAGAARSASGAGAVAALPAADSGGSDGSGGAYGDETTRSLRTQIANRRRSLVAGPAVFGEKEYVGDVFSTRGEYTEGMIYASRQQAPLAKEERARLQEKMEAQSAITQLARAQARRASAVQAQLKELEARGGGESQASDELEERAHQVRREEGEGRARPRRGAGAGAGAGAGMRTATNLSAFHVSRARLGYGRS